MELNREVERYLEAMDKKYPPKAVSALAAIMELADENKRLSEENERLTKDREELIVTLKMNDAPFPDGLQIVHDFCEKGKRAAKADTLRDIQIKFAMHFGTYTDKDTIKVSDVFKLLSKFADEMLEEQG